MEGYTAGWSHLKEIIWSQSIPRPVVQGYLVLEGHEEITTQTKFAEQKIR